jgi:hypothetical protein
MDKLNDSGYEAAKILLMIFVSCVIFSFLYVVFTGAYNGDFLGIKVTIPIYLTIINLFLSLLPYYFTWLLYKHFKVSEVKKNISVPLKFFGIFLIFIMIWNIVVTLLYGVGVMTADPYNAPAGIKTIIQILNRINYVYGFFIYFLASSKKNKTQILLIFLLLLVSYLRAGMGIFLYIIMFSIIKYYDEVILFVRKRKVLIIGLIIIFPIILGALYDLRSSLREENKEELSSSQLFFGRLAGRMSSFSDSGIIIQEPVYFIVAASKLENLYFQKQVLAGIFSTSLMPSPRPEQTLFWLYGPESNENVSYMPGTQGNLYFSLLKSWQVFLINLLTYIAMVYLTFYLARLLKFRYANEYAFALLLYVVTSGVPNEYSLLFFSIFVYDIIFLIVNFSKNIHK